jgi:glycosyltransferase involved in cell wall biosynthesis
MDKADTFHTTAKLLFVSNSCWSLYNFRRDIIEYFSKAGYEIHVAASKDDFAMLLVNIGCKVHDIQFNNRRLNPIEDLQLFYTLKSIYKNVRPDLIFHYVVKPNIYGSIAASQLKIPSVAVITGLGYAFAKKNWLSRLITILYKISLRHVYKVWMLNAADKDIFLRNNIVDSNKITVLQSEGINTEKFRPALKKATNEIFIFLMATRMLWSKGVGFFAEASEMLQQKGLIFECRLIGFFEPGHPDSIPVDQLEVWKNKKIFTVLGFSENVIPYFENADCFVLPSYYQEGVPRSLLEAGAMQVPSITTNNEGCKEVIRDGLNGFICEMKDAKDLADKMEKMIRMDNNVLKKMGCQARELVVQKFDVKFVLEKYISLLSELKL